MRGEHNPKKIEVNTGSRLNGLFFFLVSIMMIMAIDYYGTETKDGLFMTIFMLPFVFIGLFMGLGAFTSSVKYQFIFISISALIFGMFIIGLGIIWILGFGSYFGILFIILAMVYYIWVYIFIKMGYEKRIDYFKKPPCSD